MEYFILLGGAKQGPFDLITMIKKVKNGSLTPASMVAQSLEGPYIEAAEVEEVAKLIEEHANPSISSGHGNVKMSLKAAIQEGMELWTRRVLDYTLIAGLILSIGFGVGFLLKPLVAEGSILPGYIASVIAIALFFEFCYYVLETKRSQQANLKDLLHAAKKTLPAFLVLGLILGLFVLPYGINIQVGVISSFFAMVVITALIFTPFLATDGNMGVLVAAKLSVRKVLSIGGDNFGVLFAIISINLFAAIVPAMLMPQLLGLGLFLSIPVTISAVAYIYDQIFI